MTFPEVAMYRVYVPKQLCPETVLSRSGYVPKRSCPETVMSRNSYVPKWLCPETAMSRSGYVPKRLCPETVMSRSDRHSPTGGAANHYFVLKLHLRLRVFWAVAPSSQADLCMI